MTSRPVEIEVWIAMNEAGDYEVGCDEHSAIDRLEGDGGGVSRRLVQLRVTMSAPAVMSADVTVPEEAGQTITVKVD